MDEMFEVLVLSQLRVFDKPVALYNVNHYYDDLIRFIEHATKEGFVRAEHSGGLIVSDDPKELLEKMRQFKPTDVRKWVDEIKEQINN